MGCMREIEWIRVPEGEIVYTVHHRIMEGDCQTEHGPVLCRVSAFEITKYPVTNEQYLRFTEESGYTPADGGNFLRQLKDGLTDENRDLPVTFVSPDDAAAFAEYLHAKLPTERQWQRAAEGPDGYEWPWGNAYDSSRLNAGGKAAEPVDAHPDGESAFHVADMCGNTWEWTRGIVNDGHHLFTLLRGGCWYRGEHFWHFTGGPHPIHTHEKFPLLGGNFNRTATVSFRCVREDETHG